MCNQFSNLFYFKFIWFSSISSKLWSIFNRNYVLELWFTLADIKNLKPWPVNRVACWSLVLGRYVGRLSTIRPRSEKHNWNVLWDQGSYNSLFLLLTHFISTELWNVQKQFLAAEYSSRYFTRYVILILLCLLLMNII